MQIRGAWGDCGLWQPLHFGSYILIPYLDNVTKRSFTLKNREQQNTRHELELVRQMQNNMMLQLTPTQFVGKKTLFSSQTLISCGFSAQEMHLGQSDHRHYGNFRRNARQMLNTTAYYLNTALLHLHPVLFM